MCTALTAMLWQPSWLLASQSSVIEVKEQSFSQHQAEARREVQGAGAAVRVVRSSHGSGTRKLLAQETWSPSDLIHSGSLERKACLCTSAGEQRQQGFHPLCAVCLWAVQHHVCSCGFPVREQRCPVLHAHFQHQKRTEVKMAAGHLCPFFILALTRHLPSPS